MDVIVARTAAVEASLLAQARALMDRAFAGDYDDEDWDHGLGGHHALVVDDGAVVAHASVVGRRMWVGGDEVGGDGVLVGYVESVATDPGRQGEGLGTVVMERIGHLVAAHHGGLAFLGTGEHGFYERLGWARWRGPTFAGEERTTDDDDGIMVLVIGDRAPVDVTASLRCEPRPGDDW